MNKIIHRIVNFQKNAAGDKSNNLIPDGEEEINDYILISCIDKRIIPNDFTKVPIGHLYVVRNAGNFVPTYDHHNDKEISSEGGAIELAVCHSLIKDIIISGHSDCKAMEYLSKLHQTDSVEHNEHGPLNRWIRKYGKASWNKYQNYMNDRSKPIKFQLKPAPTPLNNVYLDPNLPVLDCLSQINCLQQTENVATFPFLREDLLNRKIKLHTLWKEISNNEEDPTLYLFDIHDEKFLKISYESSDHLIQDLEQSICE